MILGFSSSPWLACSRPSCGEWGGQLSGDQECRRWVGLGGAGRGYPVSDAGLVTTAHWHHGTMATNTAAKVAEGEAAG